MRPPIQVTHDISRVIRDQQPRVQRALRRFGVHERDLPDATQDVFIVVLRRLPTFEGRSSLSTWIYRIAFHVASEHRRRACNRREVLVDVESTDTSTFDPERRDRLEHVTRALDQIDPDKREVWIDFELDEQPMATIAARLGIPLKTAFSRLYAARRDLSRRLRESGLALVLPSGWSRWQSRRSGASLTWITSLAAVVLLVPELHTDVHHDSLVTQAHANERLYVAARAALPTTVQTKMRDPIRDTNTHTIADGTPTPRKTTPRLAAPANHTIALTRNELTNDDDLIVFHDSEITLTPQVPPPMQAELPPMPAREPRIQLRGRRNTGWKLTRR